MNKMYTEGGLVAAVTGMFFIMPSVALTADKVVVVPLGGVVGNAFVTDVVKGKTFSSKAEGKGVTGTLVLPPCAQTYTNSIGMTFNLIPAGSFTMGSPDGSGSEPVEPGRFGNETQHEVTLTKSFYMQTTEVTQKQWQDVIHTNPAGSNIGDNYPVEQVNWFEAAYFANELSALESPTRTECYDLSACSGVFGSTYTCTSVVINSDCTGYRLPTEAEWEYSTRATTTTAYANPYSFDATDTEIEEGFNSNLHAMGWYEFNNEGGDLSRDFAGYPSGTKPVAQKQANRWGLYDMHGNVEEWCQDWYVYDLESGTDPQGPTDGSRRVMRGGRWRGFAMVARSACRHSILPEARLTNSGFRLTLPAGQ